MLPDSSAQALKQPAEVEQPGLSRLREAVANAAQDGLPSRQALLKDGLAGLNSAISSVPDGLAAGILVGVNPVYGLYASIAGPIAGRGHRQVDQFSGRLPRRSDSHVQDPELHARLLKDGEKNQYNKVVAILLDGSNLLLSLGREGRPCPFVRPP